MAVATRMSRLSGPTTRDRRDYGSLWWLGGADASASATFIGGMPPYGSELAAAKTYHDIPKRPDTTFLRY
jgi:hypothetical protein